MSSESPTERNPRNGGYSVNANLQDFKSLGGANTLDRYWSTPTGLAGEHRKCCWMKKTTIKKIHPKAEVVGVA